MGSGPGDPESTGVGYGKQFEVRVVVECGRGRLLGLSCRPGLCRTVRPALWNGLDSGISPLGQGDRQVLVRILRSGDLSQNILCHRRDGLTIALHRIAARLRFLLNPNGHGWAARGERGRSAPKEQIERRWCLMI